MPPLLQAHLSFRTKPTTQAPKSKEPVMSTFSKFFFLASKERK